MDPNLVRYIKENGLVFFVGESVPNKYHADIKKAAAAWNQHLPEYAHIRLAFSEQEWKNEARNSHLRQHPDSDGTESFFSGFLRKFGFYNSHAAIERTIKQRNAVLVHTRNVNFISFVSEIPSLREHYLFQRLKGWNPLGATLLMGTPESGMPGMKNAYTSIDIHIIDLLRNFCASQEQEKCGPEGISFFDVMVHEFGHALGFDHNLTNKKDAMWPKNTKEAIHITADTIQPLHESFPRQNTTGSPRAR